MPLQYKLPGYAGNALLLLISIIICAQGSILIGLLLGALAILNLYLVYKLDTFSRPEGILVHQLEMTKVREELLAAQRRVSDLESSIASPPR
jgi:hypothetical protein